MFVRASAALAAVLSELRSIDDGEKGKYTKRIQDKALFSFISKPKASFTRVRARSGPVRAHTNRKYSSFLHRTSPLRNLQRTAARVNEP